MIKIIENRKDRVLFEKQTRDELWWNDDCSDENLKKKCNREADTITRVQFIDGKYIGSELMVYFKNNESKAT